MAAVFAASRRSAARTSGRRRNRSAGTTSGRSAAKGTGADAARSSSSPGRTAASTHRRFSDATTCASSDGMRARVEARLISAWCTSSSLTRPASKRPRAIFMLSSWRARFRSA